MRPPPFILVLKSNAPDPSKMAGTRGGRMFFWESEFVSKTEHVERSGRWLSAPALRVHGPHSGAAGSFGTRPACISITSHAASQGQHGGTTFPVLPGALAFLFSDDTVGPGFRPETAPAAARGKPDALLAPQRNLPDLQPYNRSQITFCAGADVYRCACLPPPLVVY